MTSFPHCVRNVSDALNPVFVCVLLLTINPKDAHNSLETGAITVEVG